jgi:hypothetical protein
VRNLEHLGYASPRRHVNVPGVIEAACEAFAESVKPSIAGLV